MNRASEVGHSLDTEHSVRETLASKQTLTGRLSAYAVMTSVAGVGGLGLPQTADAAIAFTPAHVELKCCGDRVLDLNHDGVTDFIISAGAGNVSESWINVSGLHGNEVVSSGIPVYLFPGAARLPKGAKIGPGDGFVAIAGLVGCYPATGRGLNCIGNWSGGAGFVGLQFTINGQVHYGWACFNVFTKGSALTAILSGYAYETTPAKPLLAGETSEISEGRSDPSPPTLGLLALGAPGLHIWRRDAIVLEPREAPKL